VIACISKLTRDVVSEVVPDHEEVHYVPHSVNTEIFCKLPSDEVLKHRLDHFPGSEKKTIFFFNSRNARRKQSGSLIFWFNSFLDNVGRDKAILLMHTDTKDPHGQDLNAIIEHLNLTNGEVYFSGAKVAPEALAMMYNVADCTVNISDAEGFGLSAMESLACETPIIATKTGGLQEQVTNGEIEFGVALEPTSKAIIGSQEIPWIYEDRLSEEVVVAAMEKMQDMDKEERELLGHMARQHILQNYNMETFVKQWDEILSHAVEKFGSWDTRKNYKSWQLSEVK